MAPGTLQRQTRKLAEKIDGREVFVKDLVNDDLDQIDELTDEYKELEHEKETLGAQVDEEDDKAQRKALREQIRELTRAQRALDIRMLSLYVEDKDGEPFDEDTLAKVPVRVQSSLITEAGKIIYGAGDGEGPTPAASGAR